MLETKKMIRMSKYKILIADDRLSVHCLRKSYGTNLANLGTPEPPTHGFSATSEPFVKLLLVNTYDSKSFRANTLQSPTRDIIRQQ